MINEDEDLIQRHFRNAAVMESHDHDPDKIRIGSKDVEEYAMQS